MSPLFKGRRARRLLSTSLLALAGAAAIVPAAQANPDGVWEINNYRHYAADVQERVGSDEFYLATINFKVQLGVTGSADAWSNPVYEIDDIDKGEYHSIKPSMGQSLFSLGAWQASDMVFRNRGPWIYGTVSLAMEADRNDNKTRNKVLSGAALALKQKLQQYGENITPWGSGLNFLAQAGIDLVDPKNKVLREQFFRDWIMGVGVNTVIATVKNAGVWNTIKTGLRDDWIGSPRTSIVVGLDGPLGTLFDQYAGQKPAEGDQLTSLPVTNAAIVRNYKQQYSGDGARYILDVRQQFVRFGR